MKIITQFGIILFITFLGEVIVHITNIFLPANVVSMLILLILLALKIIKISNVDTVSNFFTNNLAFFFIPIGVSVINNFDIIKNEIIQFISICIMTTLITFVVTAKTIKITKEVMRKWK